MTSTLGFYAASIIAGIVCIVYAVRWLEEGWLQSDEIDYEAKYALVGAYFVTLMSCLTELTA